MWYDILLILRLGGALVLACMILALTPVCIIGLYMIYYMLRMLLWEKK